MNCHQAPLEGSTKYSQQEEVHLQTLVDLLEAYDAPTIPQCEYSFPVNSTKSFFQYAHLIGSTGIGATIGLSERLAATDPQLSTLISPILAVESRHDAFFRYVENTEPSPTPFDTGIADIWAYNAALSFVVPGSCSIDPPVPVLPKLTTTQKATPPCTNVIKKANSTDSTENIDCANSTRNAMLQFSWDPTQMPFVVAKGKQLLIGWVNQANAPIYTPLNVTTKGTGTTNLPPDLNGVAFAVLTTQEYDNVNDLGQGALAGPVTIPIS